MVTGEVVAKAMILAAGEGERLSPLTLETPKALLPINGIPLIEHTLRWLKIHGVLEVAVNLHHLGEKIKDFVGNGSRFGLRIVYSEEGTLLGTAGGVRKMGHFLDGTFVVFYGDNLTDFDLSAMIALHREKGAVATLAVFESPNPLEVGVIEMDENGRILKLAEKPQSTTSDVQSSALANGGVYVLEQEVLDCIPGRVFTDFACDVFPKIIGAGLPIYGYRLRVQDYFLDIGTMHKYLQSNEDVKAGKVRIEHG